MGALFAWGELFFIPGAPPTQEDEQQPDQDERGPDFSREEHPDDIFRIVL